MSTKIAAGFLPCFALALVPTLSQATTPRAIMLEKSAAYALDNKVRAFRVPTRNSTGLVKYYDVTVTLGVNNDGTLLPTATVAAALSPNVTSGALYPGTYTQDSNPSKTCTVTNVTLVGGRVQSFISCASGTGGAPFQLSVVTGPVTTDHPYLAELVAAGVDQRSDAGTQAWGVVTNGNFSMNGCSYYDYGPPSPVGARTNGSNIILSVYSKSTPSAFMCGGNLTTTKP